MEDLERDVNMNSKISLLYIFQENKDPLCSFKL